MLYGRRTGLVADEDVQARRHFRQGAAKGHGLQTDGAVGEPVELGEVVYEQGFGFRGGSIVGFETGHESFELGGIFAFDEYPAGSEAVFEGVFAGCGSAGCRARAAFGLSFGCFIGVGVGVEGLAHRVFPV